MLLSVQLSLEELQGHIFLLVHISYHSQENIIKLYGHYAAHSEKKGAQTQVNWNV